MWSFTTLAQVSVQFISRCHAGLVVLGYIRADSESMFVCTEANHTSLQVRPLQHGKTNKGTNIVKKSFDNIPGP